jgi:hypothetical protein
MVLGVSAAQALLHHMLQLTQALLLLVGVAVVVLAAAVAVAVLLL